MSIQEPVKMANGLREGERRRAEHSRRLYQKQLGKESGRVIGGRRGPYFYKTDTHILDLANGKQLDVQVHRAPKDSGLGDWVWVGDTDLHIVIGKPDPETQPDKKYSVYVTANRNIADETDVHVVGTRCRRNNEA